MGKAERSTSERDLFWAGCHTKGTIMRLRSWLRSFQQELGQRIRAARRHGRSHRTETLEARCVLAATHPLNVGTLTNGQAVAFHSGQDFDDTGFSVASIGDVNGDGFDDVAITAPSNNNGTTGAGELYVLFGSASGLNLNVDPSDLNGRNGFVMRGFITGAGAGLNVAGGGDFNNDGLSDFVIGQPFAEDFPNGQTGVATIVFGTRSPHLSVESLGSAVSGTLRILGGAAADQFGDSLSLNGDVNGDGFADLIVGAPHANSKSGSAFVIFGHATNTTSSFNTLSVNDLDGSNGFRIDGTATDGFFGDAVASAGDVNGDGYSDIVVGSPGVDQTETNAGQVHLVFGQGESFSATVTLGDLVGGSGLTSEPIVYEYLGNPDERIGFSVASAGDFNRDGFDDVVIGGGLDLAFVVFGRPELPQIVNLTQLGQPGEVDGMMVLNSEGAQQGYSVAGGFDFNGDGFSDVIFGSPDSAPNGANNSGAAFVLFGSSTPPATFHSTDLNGNNGFAIEGASAGDFLGHSVASGGDFNGDGFDELLVGATSPTAATTENSEAYLIFGGNVTPNANTQVGNGNANTLNGTHGADRLIGGRGNDVLNGLTGNDVLLGGLGNDTFLYSLGLPSVIDGGRGVDTVRLPALGSLNLDTPTLNLRSIERIDLSANGANRVTVSPLSVLNLSDETNTLTIIAGPDDTLGLIGQWTFGGFQTINGRRHSVFESGAARVVAPVTIHLAIGLPKIGGDYELLLEGGETVVRDTTAFEFLRAPRAAFAGLEFVGSVESDHLTVIFDSNNPIPLSGLTFIAFGPIGEGGDSLRLVGSPSGGTFQRIVTRTTIDEGVLIDGEIQLDTTLIRTRGIEHLSDELTAIRRELQFNTVNDVTDHRIEFNGTLDTLQFEATGDDGLGIPVEKFVQVSTPLQSLIVRGSHLDDVIIGTLPADYVGTASIFSGAGNDLVSLASTEVSLTINGEAGNDTILGGAANDRIVGGIGNDNLIGTEGNDTLVGDAGNDSLSGLAGDDLLIAGDGNDTLVGGADNDVLQADAGDDVLLGDDGDDQLVGGTGNDTLNGGDGSDRVQGNGGNNTFRLTEGDGEDTLLGNSSGQLERLEVTLTSDSSVTINDSRVEFSDRFSSDPHHVASISRMSVLRVEGNHLANHINAQSFTRGSAANPVTLLGGNSDDILNGPLSDPSIIDAGLGHDTLTGGSLNDTLIGGPGEDDYFGGQGQDELHEENSHNMRLERVTRFLNEVPAITLQLEGGQEFTNTFRDVERLVLIGNDSDNAFLLSPPHADNRLTSISIQGLGGDDLVTMSEAVIRANSVTFDGGEGEDRLSIDRFDLPSFVFDSSNNSLVNSVVIPTLPRTFVSGLEELSIQAGAGNNHLSLIGFLGRVTLRGGGGNDTLAGGSFDDLLDGEIGNDQVSGNAGDDVLFGGTGNDTISGGIGDDILLGGDGADSLRGDGGNDRLTGGIGNDSMSGGDGEDALVENGNVNFRLTNVQLTGVGTDVLSTIEAASLTGGVSNNTLDATGAAIAVTLFGGDGNDRLVGGTLSDSLDGGNGSDTLLGENGNDTLNGGSGDNSNDSLNGGNGNDLLFSQGNVDMQLTNAALTGLGTDSLTSIERAELQGGAGNNRLNASNATIPVTLSGEGGNDTLTGNASNDVLNGNGGDDVLFGLGGNDTLRGGVGDDELEGNDGNDGLYGSTGNDILRGLSGNDTVLGGTGNDTLFGGDDNDTLQGDTGEDVLDGGNGTDTRTAPADANDVTNFSLELFQAAPFLADWISDI